MAVNLYTGDSGSGKTHFIIEEMIRNAIDNPKKTIIYIVPEQYTLQAQKELIVKSPRKGIMNIEVLSFERLAFRMHEELNLKGKVVLKDVGKSIIIRKLIEDKKEDYPIFYRGIKKQGYVKEIRDLLSEFHQYEWKQEDFEKLTRENTSLLLYEKLKDGARLLNEFDEFLKDKYITGEGSLDYLAKAVNKSSFLKNAEVYIDGFYGFKPIQYAIINELINTVLKLSIVITMGSEEDYLDLGDETALFLESRKIANEIVKLAKAAGQKYQFIKFEQDYRHNNRTELRHLKRNIFNYPTQVYNEKIKDINMCVCLNMRTEVKYLADSVMKLVMENGYRFRDIVVLTGNISEYESVIRQVFSQYDIPFFMDQKKDIMTNPLITAITSVLEILINNFSYESVFRYLKCGILELNQDILDKLENYILAYGIRGYRSWNIQWEKPYPTRGISPEDKEKTLLDINRAREYIIKPIFKLKDKLHGVKPTVIKITEGIKEFLEQIKAAETIEKQADEFEVNGELVFQREYLQVYQGLMEILQQYYEILGDQKVSVKIYLEYLKAGLQEYELGLLPPSIDQIHIGDITRSRIQETPVLFVMGFNEGKIPGSFESSGIISDFERIKLKQLGCKMDPDIKEKILREPLSIYVALARASEKMYLSYSKSDLQGNTLRPSMLFNNIYKSFPQIKVRDIDELYSEICVVNRAKPTFYRIIEMLNNNDNKVIEDIALQSAYCWFEKNDDWKQPMRTLKKAIINQEEELKLDEEDVEQLYGKIIRNSVSRLEMFARCPFSHFVKYGLGIEERMEYRIKSLDLGMLFHSALEICSNSIENRGLDWESIDDKARDNLVEQAIKEIIDNEARGIYNSSFRNKQLANRLTRITKRALWVISKQIKAGKFRPADYELEFDAGKHKLELLKTILDKDKNIEMQLRGRIDRVDVYENEDTMYLTVVDYKSSGKKLDFTSIYYGLNLQLLMYLNAASEIKKTNGKNVVPAGAFFFHLNDPVITNCKDRKIESINREIQKELKLKGLVLNDKFILDKLDENINIDSLVLPVTMKKDGEATKNSSTVSKEEMQILMNYVLEKAEEIGKNIVSGNISVAPYWDEKGTACDYCDYNSICRFEKNVEKSKYCKLEAVKKEEISSKFSKKS